ncbi:unnamed protein product [Hymenolepis diminuta]|uniref:C2H2-type domain-containing protein n=1 Tax=Hymenolepis diminuta TaxID=6216 RepID=A0A564YAW2_HYMDI|nr:unnamed protein product [Hymenolepis diminuta]
MYGKDSPALIFDELFNVSHQYGFIESKCDYRKTSISESNPSCDQLPATVTGYFETPYLDTEFPVAHGHYLQVDDLIPVKVSNALHVASSKDLLRPSTRILCRAGRSIVAEQYRRMNLGKIKLKGVKPKKLTEEALQRERELLQRTLPGAGVAVARLRWDRKNLGDLYKLTCVKEGCCYHSYSYEYLIKHLKMGHYVLEELLPESEDDPNDLNSPCLCYPINPLKMTDHGRNIYICQQCDLSFGSQKSIVNHYFEMHNENITESNDLNVFDTCNFCGELVEKESHKLQVCRLHLDSKLPKFMWNEIGRYLEYDPARGVCAHVLTSLMLFPNVKSPLLMVKDVFDAIQEKFGSNLEDVSRRFISAISAFRGSYHFCGQEAYKGAVDGTLDVVELEKMQALKRPHIVIDTEDDEEASESRKKSRSAESYDLKKQILLANKSSTGESFERKKKFIVIQNRSEDDTWNSSPHKSPSIVRIIHPPKTAEAGNPCLKPLDVRSNVVVVTEPKTITSAPSLSLVVPAKENAPSKLPAVLPRVLSVSHPSSGAQRPIVVRVSNPSDVTKVTSALDSAPRMSTLAVDGLSNDLISKSRLVSKIMGMNQVQSFSPPAGSGLRTNQTASKNSGVVEEKTASKREWESVLARNVAEEVAKRIAQKSPTVVPKLLRQGVQDYTSFFQSKSSSDNMTKGPSNSLGHSTKTTADIRRRQRKRIDFSLSNSEGDPSVSYPFESPESANLIKTWLKRSGTDVSKLKPSELPKEIAALFGLKESNAARSFQKNSQVHNCKYCGMSFEKLEILWAHCVRHHLKEDFKAKSPLTAPSTSGKRYSVGPSTLSVPKGSVKYPLKLTSRFSVSPTSLVGIQTAKSGSSSKDMGCQKETPKEQDKPNPSRSVSRRESKSVENKSNEISLMCPLCKFSSTSREAIMQHVLDSH